MDHTFCLSCMEPAEPGRRCPACGAEPGSIVSMPHHLPPGTILQGRYLTGRVLSEGGFGVTCLGRDLKLDTKVAIKEYLPAGRAGRNAARSLEVSLRPGTDPAEFEQELQRFEQEARIMARLSRQPAIVPVRDVFRENGTACLVMDYINGITLQQYVDKNGKIPAEELLQMAEPVFQALEAMHDMRIIHRDISPENLMLEGRTLRLLDFGCARELETDRPLTVTLKRHYAPVEQYQSQGQGPWTDVYALAATLYCALTGVRPPLAMDRVIEDELIPPRRLGANLTEAQEKALLRALSVRPRHRYQSMARFREALYGRHRHRPPADTDPQPAAPVRTPDIPEKTQTGHETAALQTGQTRPRRPVLVPALLTLLLLTVLLYSRRKQPQKLETPAFTEV